MSVHGGLITVVGVWCVRTLRAHSDVGLNLSASAGLPRTLMATVLTLMSAAACQIPAAQALTASTR